MKRFMLALASLLIPTYLMQAVSAQFNYTNETSNDTINDPDWLATHIDNMTLRALENVGVIDLTQDLDYDRVTHSAIYEEGNDEFRGCIDNAVDEQDHITGYDIMDCTEEHSAAEDDIKSGDDVAFGP